MIVIHFFRPSRDRTISPVLPHTPSCLVTEYAQPARGTPFLSLSQVILRKVINAFLHCSFAKLLSHVYIDYNARTIPHLPGVNRVNGDNGLASALNSGPVAAGMIFDRKVSSAPRKVPNNSGTFLCSSFLKHRRFYNDCTGWCLPRRNLHGQELHELSTEPRHHCHRLRIQLLGNPKQVRHDIALT